VTRSQGKWRPEASPTSSLTVQDGCTKKLWASLPYLVDKPLQSLVAALLE